jgi:hypothetical protein
MPTGLFPELAVDRKIEGMVVDFQNYRPSPPLQYRAAAFRNEASSSEFSL